MAVTALYAALAAFFFVYLSFRVIGARRSAKVALGDGSDATLQRRMRAHGNFAEYAPLALILMALAEAQGAPLWTLHGLGLMLLAGRALHAYGVCQDPEPLKYRQAGMALTFASLALGGLLNLGLVGWSLLQ